MFALLAAFALCERSFKIVGNEFQMDGKPFQYISGSIHYFRQQPSAWDSTIRKLANGGLNCVQTYVAWNLHEPHKGEFNWEGNADLIKFIETCAKYGIYVILRPGPFICAEWDFGGLPYWLLKEEGMVFRSSDEVYLRHVDDWFKVLFAKIKPHMYMNGGNIIMVQIENEYGSYTTCDQAYLKHLADVTRDLLGKDTLLFTTDGPGEGYLKCGSIVSEAYATVDFGCGDPTGGFELERRWNGGSGPYVNSEFYPGWLDHWGEKHARVDAESVASSLDKMLSMGGNVNFYMYLGGTNFDFFNGANGGSNQYQPDPTSYDYDAPLSEAADMTWKWGRILDVIKKYRSDIPTYEVSNSTKKAYGKVTFTEGVSMWDVLEDIATNSVKGSDKPVNMEDFDIDFGFTVYSTTAQAGTLNLPKVHDRAYVFVDKNRKGIVQHAAEKPVDIPAGKLDILVENQGRLNFGGEFVEKKGLVQGATVNGQNPGKWDNIGFNLKKYKNIKWTSTLPTGGPAFYRGKFQVDEVADTFLNPTGWTKGVAIINGHNCGRYWTIGPQLTLFIPAEFLKVGENELIIFEYEKLDAVGPMTFDDTPQIDIF